MKWARYITIFATALFIGYRLFLFFLTGDTQVAKVSVAKPTAHDDRFYVAALMADDEAISLGREKLLPVVKTMFDTKGKLVSLMPPCDDSRQGNQSEIDWNEATIQVVTVRAEFAAPDWYLKVEVPLCNNRLFKFTLPLKENVLSDSLFVVPDLNQIASQTMQVPNKEELANTR